MAAVMAHLRLRHCALPCSITSTRMEEDTIAIVLARTGGFIFIAAVV
jgi:hypothetical protein